MTDIDTNSPYYPFTVTDDDGAIDQPVSIPMRSDIAEGRAKQQAAEREREAYAAEEMTAVEKLRAAQSWPGKQTTVMSGMYWVHEADMAELRKLLDVTE